jgi:hypothetical protein
MNLGDATEVRPITVRCNFDNRYESKRPVASMKWVNASQPVGERTPFHEKGVSVDWSARMSFCRSRVYLGQ